MPTANPIQPTAEAPSTEPATARLNQLHEQVAALRDDVARTGAWLAASWGEVPPDAPFYPAAANLAHYLALRRHDLSALQPRLSAFGLSSLGRSEARVLPSLDAMLATLARLTGAGDPEYPDPAALTQGSEILRREQQRLFGSDPVGSLTRIMVTLPAEAGHDAALACRLMEAGMNCARINCAHDNPDVWASMIANVRAAAEAAGRSCRVLMDIAGPKCRLDTVRADRRPRLFRGDRFVLVRDLVLAEQGDDVVATLSFPNIIDTLVPGTAVWINDGKVGARIVEQHAGRAVLEVFSVRAKGAKLKPEKGVNLPGTELHLPPVTPDDFPALDFVARHADLVGFSFVQRRDDIALLDRELARRRPGMDAQPVILKIETATAVRNLPSLIVAAAATRPVAVMIARGDLAVELGFSRLSEIQEEILWLCDAAHVPVVWATQVLDNLVADGSPSRAEATDAAMSQRAECVMLNKGPFLVEAVLFLKDVLHRMDRHQAKKSARLAPLRSWTPESQQGVHSRAR